MPGLATALILSYKQVSTTPRILKEVDWLETRGWQVDTIGLGKKGPSKGRHFSLESNSALRRYAAYLVPNQKLKFDFQIGQHLDQITADFLASYDLLIIHDLTLMPHVTLRNEIARRKGQGVQIDLHEDHLESLARNRLEALVFDKYRAWELNYLLEISKLKGNRVSYTSVSHTISSRFSRYLKTNVETIRNSPRYRPFRPSNLDPGSIQLIHHGVGAPHRGIEASIRAMSQLGKGYHLNLLLLSSRPYLMKVQFLVRTRGLQDRVTLHKPVKTVEIAAYINQFDIALMIIPPVTTNELHVMPNKFFESVQACLAIVTGPNPDLAKTVDELSLGVVAKGWATGDIVNAIQALSASEWSRAKDNSRAHAADLSALVDEDNFMRAVSRTIGPGPDFG